MKPRVFGNRARGVAKSGRREELAFPFPRARAPRAFQFPNTARPILLKRLLRRLVYARFLDYSIPVNGLSRRCVLGSNPGLGGDFLPGTQIRWLFSLHYQHSEAQFELETESHRLVPH